MSKIKTLALATVLVFGASQLAFAQYGGSGGSTSGGSTYGSGKNQPNSDRSSGKTNGGGSGMGQ
jgi:hypothetical protein